MVYQLWALKTDNNSSHVICQLNDDDNIAIQVLKRKKSKEQQLCTVVATTVIKQYKQPFMQTALEDIRHVNRSNTVILNSFLRSVEPIPVWRWKVQTKGQLQKGKIGSSNSSFIPTGRSSWGFTFNSTRTRVISETFFPVNHSPQYKKELNLTQQKGDIHQ